MSEFEKMAALCAEFPRLNLAFQWHNPRDKGWCCNIVITTHISEYSWLPFSMIGYAADTTEAAIDGAIGSFRKAYVQYAHR